MTLSLVKAKDAPKSVRSKMETLLVTVGELERWKLPVFQRPLRENDKVRCLAEELKCKDGGCVPGVVTLGRVPHDDALYVVDGQHRIHAAKISSLPEVIVDVRVCDYANMQEMADDFVRLNSAIVRMRPDDILRGMEGMSTALQRIRKNCPYVGYDQIRRGADTGPVVSMSALLRAWCGSANEVPKGSVGAAVSLAASLEAEDTKRLVVFLERAHASWGRDPEYYRLWSGLNLTICMWLWRRMVLKTGLTSTKRWTALTADQYASCMVALSADSQYMAWLVGRQLTDDQRSPCYRHVRRIFAKRLVDESGQKVMFPQPAWLLS